MKPLSKYFLLMLLGTLAFGSCRKDERQEPNERPIEEGKTVTLSLSAEVSLERDEVPTDDLRGIKFVSTVKGSQTIPVPQFDDNALLDVHTIIKSSQGYTYAKTLKWKYVKSEHKLVLSLNDPGNSISIPNFNNASGVKWYIAGLYADGTTLNETNQTVTLGGGERKLLASSGNVGEVIGNFSVPYWTGWMELTLHTKDSDNNYLHGDAKSSTNKFRPLGTLIKYQLGNKQTAGAYTFSPTGFTVMSNAFSDKGTFNFFGSTIPMTDPQDAKPTWEATQAPMVYSFASGHAPSTIAHNGTSSKVYYAWVMPYESQPATVDTRVMLKGTSSKYTAHPERDFTKTYFTDYTPTSKASGGKLQHGKIQLLSANATQRVALPIEHVTEYNLAGGGLLQSLNIDHVPIPQPEGIKGDLRFSSLLSDGSTPNPNPYSNDQSAYYTWYELMGITHSTYNPGGKSLQDEVNTKWPNQYFVPEVDHWWSVFPSYLNISWSSSTPNTHPDYLQLGHNQQEYYHGESEYSQGFTDPLGSLEETNNAVIYAIRFKAASYTNPVSRSSIQNEAIGSYQPLMDNLFRCAYRYTRVGGKNDWDNSNDANLTNQVKIDVVYLGDAEVTLADISNQSWWEASNPQRTAKGLGPVLSRTFPATGRVSSGNASAGWLRYRGNWSPYWSASASSGAYAWSAHVYSSGVNGNNTSILQYGYAVRLFRRNPDAE